MNRNESEHIHILNDFIKDVESDNTMSKCIQAKAIAAASSLCVIINSLKRENAKLRKTIADMQINKDN